MNTPPRPDQIIEPPPSVLSPGGAAGTFRGRLVVIFGSSINGSTGLFVYSPTPAHGNLIASIAANSGTDPYGNPYSQGFAVYAGNNATSIFLALLNNGLVWGQNNTQPTGTGGLFVVGGAEARIQNLLVATDPNAAGTAESWHTLSLSAGWSTVGGQPVPSYRLLPDGNVQLVGVATHAAFNAATNLSTAGALPVAYQPVNTQFIAGGVPNTDAGVEITTAGTVVAEPGGASLTVCRFSGTYPVNL